MEELLREISVRAHRLIERSVESRYYRSYPVRILRRYGIPLQPRIDGCQVRLDDLYILMFQGDLEIDRISGHAWIYTENHYLECTGHGTREQLEWAVSVMRQAMVLEDMARV